MKIPFKSRVLIPLFILAAVLVIFMPRTAKWGYDYKMGSPWTYETLVSKFDFPIYKTQEQLDAEKSVASNVVPYYKFSDEVVNKSLKSAEGLSFADYANLRADVVAAMRKIFDKGVVSDEGVILDKSSEGKRDAILYIQKDKRVSKRPVTEVYTLTAAREKLLADLSRTYPSVNLDSLFRESGAYQLIVPDLIYDQQTTQLVSSNTVANVSPTNGYVMAGQLIVSQDEIVTSEIAQMLDSYRKEYESNISASSSSFLFWLGNILIALSLTALIYLAIRFTNHKLFKQNNRYYYLLTIFALTSITALLVGRLSDLSLYMVPFTLPALYLQAFFRKRVVFSTYMVSLLPLLMFSHSGVALFVMFLIAGAVATFTSQAFDKGWRQFLSAFITFCTLVAIYMGFYWTGMVGGNVGKSILYLFIGSLLTVAGYPLIYLFERIFRLVSVSRLKELCDSSNELIRQLETKAPGTFQHSLQVMNMCDAATRAIGGHVFLVRAGAMFHDIGKMNNALCFVENESLITVDQQAKYHSMITPLHSAHDIIKHVSDGVAMAQKHHIPQDVIDFILSHHGTSSVAYFYDKHLRDGGSEADMDKFKYNGVKPQSPEQVILMLADSIEAASRTLKDYSSETVSALVEKIFQGKVAEGQLSEADITLKQLVTVKEVFTNYICQVHHARVSYPDRKSNNK